MINVNTVYKSVLSILNKEQRGYLTPDEFNKVAKLAQLNLLEISFAEYNKFLSMDVLGRINAGYADLPEKIKEKIEVFYKTEIKTTGSDNRFVLPNDIFKLIDLNMINKTISLEEIDKNELAYILSSPLTKPSKDFPIYYKTTTSDGGTTVVIEPDTEDEISVDYIKIPTSPRFGYTINATYGTNIYDSATYVEGGLIIGNTLTLPGTPPTASGTGTTAALATTVAPAGGSGATIKVTSASADIDTATVVTAGSGYSIGDVIEVQMELMNSDGSIGTTNANLAITIRNADLYNTTTQGSTHFELHPTEESTIIMSILGMAGVVMKDQNITTLVGNAMQNQAAIKAQ